MTLQEIKSKSEEFYKVVDISAKSRKGEVVAARRLAIWYARERGYRFNRINEEWNIGHDVCIYHANYVNDMIELSHKGTVTAIWDVFGVDVTKDLSLKKLERVRRMFDDLLMSCPNREINELRERVEVMVNAYNYNHVSKPAEVITSNALRIN